MATLDERPGTASSWREGAREQLKCDGREIQIWEQKAERMQGESTYSAEYKRWGQQPPRAQSARRVEERPPSRKKGNPKKSGGRKNTG